MQEIGVRDEEVGPWEGKSRGGAGVAEYNMRMEGKSMRIFQVTRPNFLNCAVLGQASSQASYIAAYVDYWSVFSMVLFTRGLLFGIFVKRLLPMGLLFWRP